MNKVIFKICGIKNNDTIDCCLKNKVDFYGLIFYKKSPRNIDINNAKKLIEYSQSKPINPVGVFVNEDLSNINKYIKILNLKYIQLHGSETNEYINLIKKENEVKVIKSISVGKKNDFKKIDLVPSSDFFLFDYKPSENELPGGNSKSFDWNLLNSLQTNKPWFISGGINIENINLLQNYQDPYGIDISSGVEDKVGIKNLNKINLLFKKYYG